VSAKTVENRVWTKKILDVARFFRWKGISGFSLEI